MSAYWALTFEIIERNISNMVLLSSRFFSLYPVLPHADKKKPSPSSLIIQIYYFHPVVRIRML